MVAAILGSGRRCLAKVQLTGAAQPILKLAGVVGGESLGSCRW